MGKMMESYCAEYGCSHGVCGSCTSISGAKEWLSSNRGDLLAGLTTALAVVPTTIAFAFLGGIDPQVGLTGSWIIGLILAVFGGCPGMIYCNAGAVAIVLATLSEDKGVEHVFYAFMLAGIITVVFGFLGVHTWMRFLPASVMIGFVDGLAILIFFGQLKNFQIDCPASQSGHKSSYLGDDGGAVVKGGGESALEGGLGSFGVLDHDCGWIGGGELTCMLLNIFITMVVTFFLPSLAKAELKSLPPPIKRGVKMVAACPAALAGVIVSIIFEWAIVRGATDYKTKLVEDVAKVEPSAPVPVWANNDYTMPSLDADLFSGILQTALTITAVGLIESLMTVKFVAGYNKIVPKPKQEAVMLGVGNFVCGVFGGQGGCSEIGLTLINLNSGGKGRVSGVTSALITLLIIQVAYPIINIVPMAGLVGVMFVVCIHCFDWTSLAKVATSLLPKQTREKYGLHHKINRMDAAIIVVVTIVTPFTDLAIAVFIGCVMAMAGFAWESADRLHVETSEVSKGESLDEEVTKVYTVHGSLYYASADRFTSYFDVDTDPKNVEVAMEGADICDYSAMQCLNTLGDDYHRAGKNLRLRKLRPRSSRVMHKGARLLDTFYTDADGQRQDRGLQPANTLGSGAVVPDTVEEETTVLGGADELHIAQTTHGGNRQKVPPKENASSFL